MRPTLVLLDAAEQVEPALAACGTDASILFVAGTPQAGLELRRRGISFQYVQAFSSNRRLRAVDDGLFPAMADVCRNLDEDICGAVECFRSTGFRPFDLNQRWIRALVDNVILRIAEIGDTARATRAGRIVCCAAPLQPCQDKLCFAADESMYGALGLSSARRSG